MTTPARNINTILTIPSASLTKSTCSGGFSTLNATNGWKRYWDVRPASVTSARSRTGWRNPTAWSHDHLEAVECPIGEFITKNWCTNKVQWTGTVVRNGYTSSDDGMVSRVIGPPSWVGNLANTRAYLALKNQGANLGEAFAEWHKTQKMVTSAATDIAKQVLHFKTAFPRLWGNVKKYGAINQLRNIPNRWLELQYGWKPLMSDIFGALGVCDRYAQDTNGFHIRVKGAARFPEHLRVVWGPGNFWFDEYWERDHHVKTVLYYRLNHPVVATLASLGLTNPLELGWELVRFSFVVDWFLPIGNWLSTMDADFGWQYITGVQSTFTKIKVKSVPRHTASGPGTTYENFATGPSGSGIRFRRVILASPPGVGLPRFKNPLSAQHMANAISLLVQAFR